MNSEQTNVNRSPPLNNLFTQPVPVYQQYVPYIPQNLKFDVNCHKCIEMEQEINYMTSQMKLMNKNIELLNEQMKLLDMKLSVSNTINTKETTNKSRTKNRNRNKNNKDYMDEYTFFENHETVTTTPIQTNNSNTEPTFIIQFDEFVPPPPSTSQTAQKPPDNNPFGLLGSLLNIFAGNKKTEPSNEITNIETTEEYEYSDHDSDEEFEELNIDIKNIDDLISLGKKYDVILEKELKEQEKKEKELKEQELKEQELKEKELKEQKKTFIKKTDKFGFDKVLMRDGTTRSLKDPIQEAIIKNTPTVFTKSIETNPTKEEIIDSKILTKDCIIDGKKYSINLKVLHKLIKPLNKLKSMIGLEKVKNSIIDMILYYLQNFENKNNDMLHTVIEGPPGVGKTQLGKILAEIYAGLGVIPSSKFKIVKRSDLVGEYLGHTAPKTQKVIDEADGGVLFIDEAYSLGNEDKKDSFSQECINTLNQNLSENKKKFICIIAGYPDELDKCFFSFNPGLKRRFPFKFQIEGYSPEELKGIFLKKVSDIKWKITDTNDLTGFFKQNKDNFPFYGGDIDNFLLSCKFVHSRRVFGKHPKNKRKLNQEDLTIGFDRFVQNKKNKERREENDSIKRIYL